MQRHSLAKLPTLTKAVIAAVFCALIALLLCLLFAAAAAAAEDPTAHLDLYGEIVFAVSMLLCGFVGAKLSEDARFPCGMLSGGILLLLTIAASFCFSGGSFAKGAVLCGIGAFLTAIGAVLGAREPKRRRRR